MFSWWRRQKLRLALSRSASPNIYESFLDQVVLRNLQSADTVAVMNVRLTLYSNALEYARAVVRYLTLALDQGTGVIVFPELFGNLLMGMAGEPVNLESKDTLEMLYMISPVLVETYMDIFQQVSSKTDAVIVGGTMVYMDNDRLVNRAFVFRRGNVIWSQDKAHLMPLEERWGIARGARMGLFDVGTTKAGLLICMDATYYEQARILENMGARLLLVPSANPAPFYMGEQIRGAWARAQTSQVFTAQSFLVGKIGNLTFEGKAGVYAPASYTDDGSGIVALANKYDEEEIVVAKLDFDKLARVRKPLTPRYQSELSKFYQSKGFPDRF
ncbi:hydrolase [Coprothermobacteraceae bacterium]|nr:hydrolase [Coprothermobacteraceae bacterium]